MKIVKQQISVLIIMLKVLTMSVIYNFIIKKLITTKIKIMLDLKEQAEKSGNLPTKLLFERVCLLKLFCRIIYSNLKT